MAILATTSYGFIHLLGTTLYIFSLKEEYYYSSSHFFVNCNNYMGLPHIIFSLVIFLKYPPCILFTKSIIFFFLGMYVNKMPNITILHHIFFFILLVSTLHIYLLNVLVGFSHGTCVNYIVMSETWIYGPILRPPRSPDITPLDFSSGVTLKIKYFKLALKILRISKRACEASGRARFFIRIHFPSFLLLKSRIYIRK